MSPNDLLSISLLVFVLGMKHGFDADHLATIDGMTRFNAQKNPQLSRYCGVLFSLGHGAVVMLTALMVSTLVKHWQTPEWLDFVGTWVSISFLITLGVINLYAVFSTSSDEVVNMMGVKGRFFSGLQEASNPWMIALVGALFAISFDTISQITFFTLALAWQSALLLGAIFTLGMIVTDGINGVWISHLIKRTNQTALLASRIMSLAVAGMSLLIAGFSITKQVLPAVDLWSEGKEMLFGGSVIAILACSYVVAMWLTRKNRVLG